MMDVNDSVAVGSCDLAIFAKGIFMYLKTAISFSFKIPGSSLYLKTT